MRPHLSITLALLAMLGAACTPPTPYGAVQAQPPAAPGPRQLSFNGRAATAEDLEIVSALERRSGTRLPDGAYWYDKVSGAAGRWGGPAEAFVQAGLALGGPLPREASGGGTGVVINGRELHPVDAMRLAQYTGVAPQQGRWWVDARGNFGPENGGMLGNIHAMARMRGNAGKQPWSGRLDMNTGSSADNLNMASDGQTTCVSSGGYTTCTGP